MSRFTYTAQKTGGEIYKGIVEAVDRFELYNVVRSEGAHIIAVEEDRSQNFWRLSFWEARIGFISEYEKILFARNLGAMLSAGLALARALSVLERQSRNPRVSSILSQIESGVRHGEALHIALGKFPGIFSKLFVSMVRAGEEGGSLPDSLSVISEQTERMYILKKKVRGALVYPSVVILAMIGIGILMMTNVVPSLAHTFAEMNVDLPVSTRVIVAISNFLVEYAAFALLLAIGIGAAAWAAARTNRGKRVGDYIFLHTPIIGSLVQEVNSARTARTLSSLLASGVDVLTSLDITGEVVQNAYFREVIVSAGKAVRQGETMSSMFIKREDLYPAFVGEMMAVGEETGQSAEMLRRLAAFYEDEVDRKTKDMSTIIEPFLMIIIGSGVGFFALAMITPIYQMTENI